MKKASSWLFALALVLSHAMLAVVAVRYTHIYLDGLWKSTSLPATAAWSLALPFAAGIVVCLLLAWFFRKREGTGTERGAVSGVFVGLALVLSHSMVVAMGVSYVAIARYLEKLGLQAVVGTPPELAFLWVIPFGVGVALCLGMAHLLRKKV